MTAHRKHALTLLNEHPDLQHREAGFLGHVAVAPTLTEKQANWLALIMERRSLTPKTGGR